MCGATLLRAASFTPIQDSGETPGAVVDERPSATIRGTRTVRRQGRSHTEYSLEVSAGWRSVRLHRRYRDFLALHKDLRECRSFPVLPPLTRKVWLIGRISATFVAWRTKKLQQYLHQLLADPQYGRPQQLPRCLLGFLGLDETWKPQFASCSCFSQHSVVSRDPGSFDDGCESTTASSRRGSFAQSFTGSANYSGKGSSFCTSQIAGSVLEASEPTELGGRSWAGSVLEQRTNGALFDEDAEERWGCVEASRAAWAPDAERLARLDEAFNSY